MANVSNGVVERFLDPRGSEQDGIALLGERVSVNLGPEAMEPECEPPTLEPCVTCQEDSAGAIGFLQFTSHRAAHHQVFHGALRVAQSSLRRLYSLNVSIGCQNPLCSNATSSRSAASRRNGSRSKTLSGSSPR